MVLGNMISVLMQATLLYNSEMMLRKDTGILQLEICCWRRVVPVVWHGLWSVLTHIKGFEHSEYAIIIPAMKRQVGQQIGRVGPLLDPHHHMMVNLVY